MPRLVAHECMRTLGDRLLYVSDRKWLAHSITEAVQEHFAVTTTLEEMMQMHFGPHARPG